MNLKRKLIFKLKISNLLIIFICFLIGILAFLYVINHLKTDLNQKNKLFEDIIKAKNFSKEKEEHYKADFLNKCLLARQVYQWSWYTAVKTKLGNANLVKCYAMNLKEYNFLVEKSWQLNRELSLPLDSWENYIMLSKWILESAMNQDVEHKTGEVIKFTGYTRCGMMMALYHYKHNLNINKGHQMYIPDLFQNNLRDKDILRILQDFNNIICFDYSYILFLLGEYNYRWDWVLTAFHFGEGKTIYWHNLGLETIPNYRLDGKWEDHYLREYYQTVYEIAQGIAKGDLFRVSRYNFKVSKLQKQREINRKFYTTIKLKIKSKEDFLKLENNLKDLNQEYNEFKEKQKRLIEQMAKLNDLQLDYRRANEKGLKAWARKIYKKIKPLKKTISSNYKKIFSEKK